MRRATVLIAASALFVAALATTVGSAGADPVTDTFDVPGSSTFVVPAGVTSLTVDAWGAQGGQAANSGSAGGLGGRVTASLAVTPGDALTLVVGAVFLVKGIFQVILGIQMRPHGGWGWILTAGVLSAIVGLIILIQWPVSTTYALGYLAGISLIFSGWSYVMLSLAAKRI